MWLLVRVAWRNLWRHRRRSLITAFAMALAVGLCMWMIAFTDGTGVKMFEVMVEQRLGHVQVHHPAYPSEKKVFQTVDDASAVVDTIRDLPGTVAVSPRLNGYALLGGPEVSAGARLVGIEPDAELGISRIDERLTEGRFLSAEDEQGILLGWKLAEELEVGIGDTVVAVGQGADGSVAQALFDVVGLMRSGNAMLDKGGAWVLLDDLQAFLVLDDEIHNLTLLTDDPDTIPAFADSVRDALGEDDTLEVQTWQEADPQAASMMSTMEASKYIMLGIVFAVASFGVLNTMLMSVFERTRELGVLRAIGLRPGRLVVMVVTESLFLALLACGIGLVIGGLLDWHSVVYGLDLSGQNPEGLSFMGVTLDPVIYGVVRADGILLTLACVVGVSLLSSLWPAWRASRLQPVEAIRTE